MHADHRSRTPTTREGRAHRPQALSSAGGLGPVVGAVLARTARGQWDRFTALARQTGYCTAPVRITGRILEVDTATGEASTAYSTGAEPDGVLVMGCRNRRAVKCPPCSATYAADTWHLVAAGLVGGKGIPTSVAAHPRVFVTATAPGFGTVHRADSSGLCHPNPAGPRTCVHGRPTTCIVRHDGDDPRLGAALCVECFDYAAVVIFNALAPKLWDRTKTDVIRRLAAATGTTIRATGKAVRLSFTKVTEHQARGAVHVHAVARLDARTTDGTVTAPLAPYDDPALLAAAFTAAIAKTTVPAPAELDGTASWGPQSAVRIVTTRDGDDGGDDERTVLAVANYLAKYVTKSLPTTPGANAQTATDEPDTVENDAPSWWADAPLAKAAHAPAPATLTAREHWARLAATCLRLGARDDLAHLRLADRTEGVGYPSRPVSRSRAYSTTLGALRAARAAHARKQTTQDDVTPAAAVVDATPAPAIPTAPGHAPGAAAQTGNAASDTFRDDELVRVGQWAFVGIGWASPGEAAWVMGRATEHAQGRIESRDRARAERDRAAYIDPPGRDNHHDDEHRDDQNRPTEGGAR